MKYKRLLLCVSLVIAGVYTGNAALVTYGTQIAAVVMSSSHIAESTKE